MRRLPFRRPECLLFKGRRGQGRALLEGEGAIGAVPERLQSGHGGCESGWWGGYWRLERRLGLVLGDGNAFGVESGPECSAGGGGGC